MKRLILVLSVAAAAWMFSPTPEAQAWSWSRWSWNYHSKDDGCDKDGGAVVPELDPSAAGSAMVLLLGGMAWIASRRRDEELV
jgi:hypothetical protein